MKKILFLILVTILFSCTAEPRCWKCTEYNLAPVNPKEFVVCTPEEYDYWNGKEVVVDGVVWRKTICK
jgi:hypothetical protein